MIEKLPLPNFCSSSGVATEPGQHSSEKHFSLPCLGKPFSHSFLVNSETRPEAAYGCHGHQACLAEVESEYLTQKVRVGSGCPGASKSQGGQWVLWCQKDPGRNLGPATAKCMAPCCSCKTA